MDKKHRIEDFEKKRVILLLSKIVKKIEVEKIEKIVKKIEVEKIEKIAEGIKEDKETLVRVNLELKEIFGINMRKAKFLREQMLPTDVLPELLKFLPAFENLKSLISAVFFYKPDEMTEPKLKELKKQIKTSLIAFIINLKEAQKCINELRP